VLQYIHTNTALLGLLLTLSGPTSTVDPVALRTLLFCFPYMDRDMESVTAQILAEWDWKKEESAFGDTRDSLESRSSPGSSGRSSPELSSSSSTTSSGGADRDFPGLAYGGFPRRSSKDPGSTQRQTKHKMSTKRRVKASEREKMRMRSLAEALHHLRDYLPPGYSKSGQPLTKIQTLKYTIEYINQLEDQLNRA